MVSSIRTTTLGMAAKVEAMGTIAVVQVVLVIAVMVLVSISSVEVIRTPSRIGSETVPILIPVVVAGKAVQVRRDLAVELVGTTISVGSKPVVEPLGCCSRVPRPRKLVVIVSDVITVVELLQLRYNGLVVVISTRTTLVALVLLVAPVSLPTFRNHYRRQFHQKGTSCTGYHGYNCTPNGADLNGGSHRYHAAGFY
ncbi:hypothetical protein K501DRAFT_276690 [Backusella circina FSU 941]|nr:hypothetical protein K501DRAFT_276690 [Backusella circina FSU 941]